MFFAAQDGSFRIFPGRRSSDCDFDPRERPWYIAASSGPKNIVLVLDTSGSMAGQRLVLLKKAATRVVSTLTVAGKCALACSQTRSSKGSHALPILVTDRIAIVRFDSTATSITDPNGRMFIATQENIQTLLDQIDRFNASGSTNIYDAFNTTFAVMQQTIEDELHVDSNSAILFLTDGEVRGQEL
jgi:Mg-chelatase subunit ChlD